ncbi:Transposase IS4 [Popillia japonica]|uniref:Transposase IS4 n=1 Tax=Popillia japonica TaxID=7064 RepID=A0AAW1HF76_POPJA
MARFSTKLYKSNNCTLTIYKSTPNKKVLLLSSKHKYVKIEEKGKCIPETIAFYNNTKVGVHMTDQMTRKYSTKSKSNRWPVQVFFNILELAAINASILYKQTLEKGYRDKNIYFSWQSGRLATEYRDIHEQEKMESMATTSADPTTISERRKSNWILQKK